MVTTQTNWSNITSWGQFLVLPNNNTGGWFWAVMTYLIFAIVLVMSLNFGLETAMLVAAFAGLAISLILLAGGLVSTWVVGTFVGVILFTAIYIYWSSRYEY